MRRITNGLFLDEADRVTFEQLRAFLHSRFSPPAAFVGAGTSQALDYPSWDRLLDDLHDMAMRAMPEDRQPWTRHLSHLKRHEDLTWRAQEYRDAIASDEKYLKTLQHTFSPKGDRPGALDE